MKQLAGGLCVLLLSVIIGLQSRGFPELPDGHPGPGLFPGAVAIALFLSGAFLTASALRSRRSESTEEVDPADRGAGSARLAAVMLAVGAYPIGHELLGFVPTIAAICLLVALLLKARPLPGLLTAVGGTLVIYLLFTRLLGVPL